MESKGANINCFWKCDIKEIDGTWYQIPNLEDMKRAVEYVTNLATIGELRDRSRLEAATQLYNEAIEADLKTLGPFPVVPPGVMPTYVDPSTVNPGLYEQIWDQTVKSLAEGRGQSSASVPVKAPPVTKAPPVVPQPRPPALKTMPNAAPSLTRVP